MFATHYIIVMIIYYNYQQRTFFNNTHRSSLKQPVLEPRE